MECLQCGGKMVRYVRRTKRFNKLSKKEKQRRIARGNEYNKSWNSSNKSHQKILDYINEKTRTGDVTSAETNEFNRLMKSYPDIKKYIFVIPENKLKSVLNHDYDLKKHKPQLEKLLKKKESRKQRYIPPIHSSGKRVFNRSGTRKRR